MTRGIIGAIQCGQEFVSSETIQERFQGKIIVFETVWLDSRGFSYIHLRGRLLGVTSDFKFIVLKVSFFMYWTSIQGGKIWRYGPNILTIFTTPCLLFQMYQLLKSESLSTSADIFSSNPNSGIQAFSFGGGV